MTIGGTETVLLVSTQVGVGVLVVVVVMVDDDDPVGVTEPDAVDAEPVPTELVAVTVKV